MKSLIAVLFPMTADWKLRHWAVNRAFILPVIKDCRLNMKEDWLCWKG